MQQEKSTRDAQFSILRPWNCFADVKFEVCFFWRVIRRAPTRQRTRTHAHRHTECAGPCTVILLVVNPFSLPTLWHSVRIIPCISLWYVLRITPCLSGDSLEIYVRFFNLWSCIPRKEIIFCAFLICEFLIRRSAWRTCSFGRTAELIESTCRSVGAHKWHWRLYCLDSGRCPLMEKPVAT